MLIHSLALQNYRNYSLLRLDFSKDLNIFIGENGSGKTNIIEAIAYAIYLKSFRGSSDADIVKRGQHSFRIKMSYQSTIDESQSTLDINYEGSKKKAFIDDLSINKFTSIINEIKAVTFISEDIELLIGSPESRRRYLNMSLALLEDHYFTLLQEYNRILRQRNAALKQLRFGKKSDPFLWDTLFIEKASQLIHYRLSFINRLSLELQNLLSLWIPKIPEILVSYHPGIKDKSLNATTSLEEIKEIAGKKVMSYHEKDQQQGSTMLGPHRDDFSLGSKSGALKNFSSWGQNRSIAIALKYVVAKLYEKMYQDKLIFLMDDILLDLDLERKEALLSSLDERQYFITLTSLSELGSWKENNGQRKIFSIIEGNVHQAQIN